MDSYIATGAQAAVTTPGSGGDTALAIIASTLTRADIEHFSIGHSGAPDDKSITWLIRRLTAVGTEGAGVVPAKTDLASPVAQLDGAEDHSVEPTYTAATELWDEPLNQRATWQLWTSPKFAFKIPATANAGIGFTPQSATYVLPAEASAMWLE